MTIQLICIAPFSILRWALTGVGFAVSGYFICANVYPILQTVSLPNTVRVSSCILLIIYSGGFACEQDIHRPNRPLPRSRRLPLQSDVLQLLCRKGRHAGSWTRGDTCDHAFLNYLLSRFAPANPSILQRPDEEWEDRYSIWRKRE
jgi:hypothetical protein